MFSNITDSIPIIKDLPLTPHEKKIIDRVFFISLGITLFFIVSLFLYRAFNTPAIKNTLFKYDPLEQFTLSYAVNNMLQNGDLYHAQLIGEKLTARGKPNHDLTLLMARIMTATKDHDNALEMLRLLPTSYQEEDTIRALFIQVLPYRALKSFMQEDSLLTALQWRIFGERQLEKGDSSGYASLLHALQKDANDPDTHYLLAQYHMAKKQDSIAVNHLNTLLKTNPLYAPGHRALGLFLHKSKKYDDALGHYTTALQLNPRDFITAYNMGELYFTVFSDTKKAEDYFAQADQYAKNYGSDHWQSAFKLGIISLENNNVAEAVDYLEEAKTKAPDTIRVLHQLAIAYEKVNNPQEALVLYKEILALSPLDDIALYKKKLLTENNHSVEK